MERKLWIIQVDSVMISGKQGVRAREGGVMMEAEVGETQLWPEECWQLLKKEGILGKHN